MKNALIAVILVLVFAVGWFLFRGNGNTLNQPSPTENETTLNTTSMNTTQITLKTNKGDITIELYTEKMPVTAGNFLKLAQDGFYDGTKFHRVINGFMIQGGDPNSKENDTESYGIGGPGYTISDEFTKSDLDKNNRGTISMANAGPNTGGSQFFINHANNNFLDGKHPVFGKVTAGMDVVDTIATVPTGERDIPVNPVIIENVTVSQ